MNQELLEILVNSLRNGNLVLVCGAGLSRGEPSNAPSAAELASRCYARYLATGQQLPAELEWNLEGLAKRFFGLGQLELVFVKELVDWGAFTVSPNPGHFGVADFLCSRAAYVAVSTNYDDLIERAGELLGEKDFLATIDPPDLVEMPTRNRPLWKLHGCRTRNRHETIWCLEQTETGPIKDRLTDASAWMQVNFKGRDFIFLGFWSDWAYLNAILESSVKQIGEPRTVVLVDLAAPPDLEGKAKDLWAWAHGQGVRFFHEQQAANTFLTELRVAYSERFFRAACQQARGEYELQHGALPSAALAIPSIRAETWYDLRRDLSGARRDAPVRAAAPDANGVMAGLTILELLEIGAVLSERGFVLPSGDFVRVLAATGPLSSVKRRHMNEPPGAQFEQIVICANAVDDVGFTNIVRGEQPATVIRPGLEGAWFTKADGLAEVKRRLEG